MYKRAQKELIKQSIFAEEGTGVDFNDELEKYAGLSDDSEESSEEDNSMDSEEDSEEEDSEEDSEEDDSKNEGFDESDKNEGKDDNDEESDIDNDPNRIYTCKICPKKILKNKMMVSIHLASKDHKRRARFIKKHSRNTKEIEDAIANHARKKTKLQEKKEERLEKKKEMLKRHRKEQKKRKWLREQAAASNTNIDPNPKLETSIATNLEPLNKKTKLTTASKGSNEQATNSVLTNVYKGEDAKKNKKNKVLADSNSNSAYSGSTKENMNGKIQKEKKVEKVKRII